MFKFPGFAPLRGRKPQAWAALEPSYALEAIPEALASVIFIDMQSFFYGRRKNIMQQGLIRSTLAFWPSSAVSCYLATTHDFRSQTLGSLSWNANSRAGLAGYKVHYGTKFRTYGTSIDVGQEDDLHSDRPHCWNVLLRGNSCRHRRERNWIL